MLSGQGGERWPELQGEDGVAAPREGPGDLPGAAADLEDPALGGQPRSLDDRVDDRVRIAGPHLIVEAGNCVKRRVERHRLRHMSLPCRAVDADHSHYYARKSRATGYACRQYMLELEKHQESTDGEYGARTRPRATSQSADATATRPLPAAGWLSPTQPR